MKKPLIEFKDFSFRYKSQTEATLHDINLTIYQHEKVLLLGPSGSGKSTLAHCINGLIPHSFEGEVKGSCKIAGVETIDASIFALSKHVGTVLQDSDAQFVGLSVGEDIAFALENQQVNRNEMVKRVYASASLVGMQDFLSHVPYQLSGGQKQKVSMAGVINEDVSILLFDEPLAALDPAMGKTAIELIDDLYRQLDKTVVIIEHRLEDVLHRPVDRILLMDEGRIVADMTPEQLLTSNLLIQYGIREPLYVSALKHAGCELSVQDSPASIHQLDLSRHREKLLHFSSTFVSSQATSSEDIVLTVDNVSFAYDTELVLKDVSFALRKGEKIAVVGKNGAGKSTMAKLLCGVIRPNSGKILVENEDYVHLTIKQLGERFGYVMQNPNQMIVKEMIFDEIALALRLRGYQEEEISAKVIEVLQICGLHSMRNWPISALSYGQKKRVTIASILALSPKVLILDEPTAGQDYRHYTEMLSFIEQLQKQLNLTVIFITHDMHLAIEYTDRAIVFADGELIADNQVFKVLSNDDVIVKANLKQTSLYTLATRLDLNPEEFIEHFIQVERGKIHESK